MSSASEHENDRQEPRPKPPRRWLQFSLSTLLAVTALAAGGAMAWRVYLEPYRRQRETMRLIEDLGGSYQTTAADKWLRRLFGDDFQNITSVDLAVCDDPAQYIEQVASLPALETLTVGGPAFTDEHLRRLQGLATLRQLRLDCAEVSEAELAALREKLISVVVYDYRTIFDALLTDILTSPSLQSDREFYGTPGDKQFALFSSAGYGIHWRKSYLPRIEGFEGRHLDEGAEVDRSGPRLLGIRLNVFDLDAKPASAAPELFSGQIQVSLFNAGGNGGQPAPIGGCMVFYGVEQEGEAVSVKFRSSLDP